MEVAFSGGTKEINLKDIFEMDGAIWRIEKLVGSIYSPSGFGGTPIFLCRIVDGRLNHQRFDKYIKDDCVELCGDSIAQLGKFL